MRPNLRAWGLNPRITKEIKLPHITAKSRNKAELNGIGLIAPLTPRIKSKLKILEPIIFPATNSGSRFNAADADAANSGSDVPIATMVAAIRASDKSKERAMLTAESTTNFPPRGSSIIPSTSIVIAERIEFFGFSAFSSG